MTNVLRFFASHKILSGLFLLGFLIALSIMIHRPGWEYVKPLEKALVERYGNDFAVEQIGFDEATQKIRTLRVVVSKECVETDNVMKVCYEIQELIADYIKENSQYFSLNDKEIFSLYFYVGEKRLFPRQFHMLKFTNENAHFELSKDGSCRYEDDFVRCNVDEGDLDEGNRIERKIKISEFSGFKKMQILSFRASVEMDDLQTLLDLPQLKCLRFEVCNRTEEIEKNWIPIFEKKGIDFKFGVVLDN